MNIKKVLRESMNTKRLSFIETRFDGRCIRGTGDRRKNVDIDYTIRQKYGKRIVAACYDPDTGQDYFVIKGDVECL